MTAPQQRPPSDPQAAQERLAVFVGLILADLWPSLDLLNLRASLPEFKAAVTVEVQRYAQASATLAAQQYRQQRATEGMGAGFTPRPAKPPSVEQIAAAVDFAVQPLWDSAIPVAQFPDAPPETQQIASSAIADAKARLAAASERLVLDAGRETIIDNAQRDRRAKGWARIPEPGACHFCALLATRGAVYRSRATADFRSHDNCRCHAEAVFTSYEPSAQIREWQKLYRDATKGVYGAANQRKAFRQALEGREINVEQDTVTRKTTTPGKTKTVVRARGERTQDEIRAELAALEKNFSRLTNDKQREWTQQRLGALQQQLV